MLKKSILGPFKYVTKSLREKWQNYYKFHNNPVRPKDISLENYHYESHRSDDLALTLNKESGPGVKYGHTENSEFARGAEKTESIGIDSFGEENTFDPDEADDFQDYRNRKQNSDLSKRYYTHGMEISEDDLH